MGLSHSTFSSNEPWDIGSLITEFESNLDIQSRDETDDFKKYRAFCQPQLDDNQRKSKNVPDQSAMVVTEPNSPFAIQYVNDAWLQLCGYDSLEEVKGQNLSIIQGKETKKEVFKGLVSSVTTYGEFEVENLINYTKDGKAFKHHLRIKPFKGEDNEILSFVGIMIPYESLPSMPECTTLEQSKVERSVNFNSRIAVILIPARKEYYDVGLHHELWYNMDDYPDFANSAVREIQHFKNKRGNEHFSVQEIMKVIY
jgi:PAS domain S-box-containing protein